MAKATLKRAIPVLLIALVVVLGSEPGRSAVLRELGLQELVCYSQTIVRGTVESVQCGWNLEHTEIYTFITLSVDQYFKGDSTTQELTIKQVGGTVDGEFVIVPGSPEFEEGEEVLLFLSFEERRESNVVGMAQGKYTIEADPETGRKVLRNRLLGITFLGSSLPPEEQTFILDEFLPRLEEAVRLDAESGRHQDRDE